MTSSYPTPAVRLTTTTDLGFYGFTGDLEALLEIVTPSPYLSCSQEWYYDVSTPGTIWSDDSHNYDWTRCQPYAATAGMYSPGICPSGQEFKQVITYVETNTATTDTLFEGICCSSQWTLADTGSGASRCTFTSTAPISVTAENFTVVTTGRETITDLTYTTLESDHVVASGAVLTMLWRKNDTTAYPASLAAYLRVAMGMAAFPATATDGASASQLASATRSDGTSFTGSPRSLASGTARAGLTTGAVAGIAVGVAVAVFGLLVLGYFALRRRWAQAQETSQPSHLQGGPNDPYGATGARDGILAEMESGSNVFKHFSGNAWRNELPVSADGTGSTPRNASGAPSEVDGGLSSPHQAYNPSEVDLFDPRTSLFSASTSRHANTEPPVEMEGSTTHLRELVAPPVPARVPPREDARPDAATKTAGESE